MMTLVKMCIWGSEGGIVFALVVSVRELMMRALLHEQFSM
jgi:hypothetical protein